MTGPAPRPDPTRLGRAGVVVVAILAAVVLVFFIGRIVWHSSEVTEDPPEIQQTQQP